jgi:hypothetical protein
MESEKVTQNRVRGRAKGGVARAAALPAEKRQEIAKNAAALRWDESIPEVEYGGTESKLRLGEIELECYVLTGAMRVFSLRGMTAALGLAIRGGELQRLVDQANLRAFLDADALAVLENPIKFRPPGGGRLAFGFPVTLLIDLCNAILDADKATILPRHFAITKTRVEIIVRAVAKVGIIALVDEATGYDEHRKEKLDLLLDRYLRKELAAWSKRFPDEFYYHIFRLRNWQWKGRGVNPPSAVAHYTKDLIYARMAPGILKELERRNPVIVDEETGKRRRRAHHHRFLTEDIGEPHLNQHMLMVIGIQRASTTWEGMMESINRALPRLDETMQLPLLDWKAEDANQEPPH